MSGNIFVSTKQKLKNIISKIINFYLEPFELTDMKLNTPKKLNIPKKTIQKTKVKRSGTLSQLIDYYNNDKKRMIFIFGIFVSLIIGVLIFITNESLAWLGGYIIIVGIYTTMYSGLYYVFQRKRDVVDGFVRLMQEYIISKDLTTFKNFVKESKEIEYPLGFRDQLLEMKQSLDTKESSVVLKDFFERPENYYNELQIYKNLAINTIASQDNAITNALSDQIDYVKKSSTILESKLTFLKVFIYLILGFIFGIPAVLVYEFKTVLTSSGGVLSTINVLPSSIAYFFFLVFGGLAVVFLTITIYFGMYKEGNGIKMGLVMLYLTFIISIIIVFLQL